MAVHAVMLSTAQLAQTIQLVALDIQARERELAPEALAEARNAHWRLLRAFGSALTCEEWA